MEGRVRVEVGGRKWDERMGKGEGNGVKCRRGDRRRRI